MRWDRIEADGNPGGYARQVLIRLDIDRLRRRHREGPSSDIPEVPYVDVVAADVEPWLLEAMSTLTPRQRTAVVLRFVDDLDVAGIARSMDCAVGTAKSHLSRGMDRLRLEAPQVAQAAREEGGING